MDEAISKNHQIFDWCSDRVWNDVQQWTLLVFALQLKAIAEENTDISIINCSTCMTKTVWYLFCINILCTLCLDSNVVPLAQISSSFCADYHWMFSWIWMRAWAWPSGQLSARLTSGVSINLATLYTHTHRENVFEAQQQQQIYIRTYVLT